MTLQRWLSVSVALAVLGGCGSDKLVGAPGEETPPFICDDGSEVLVATDCPIIPPPGPGGVTGQLCDQSVGLWRVGVEARIDLGDNSIADTTDSEGRFTLEGVPPGSYYVQFTGPDFEHVLPAFVETDVITSIGHGTCIAPPGHLKGAVCDQSLGIWLEGATVTLDDAGGTTETTDQFGNFMFYSIPAGDYELSISGSDGYTATRIGTVRSAEITDLGPTECFGAEGVVTGRICGADGYWISGASVMVDLGGGASVETTTDANGNYSLSGLPPGEHTVVVEKGSFSTEFTVEVVDGVPTELPVPVCIPPNVRMAVVTGVYDEVEEVLTDLGYRIKQRFDTTTPEIIDDTGAVDIIDGAATSFWVTDFLSDPVWMSEYQIIFLNCGLDDSMLQSGGMGDGLDNLRAFVEAGGSVYASDWAADTIRLAFPGKINFFGNDSNFGGSRVGKSNSAMPATVTDAGLQTALSALSVTLNLNLDQWAVLESSSEQPSDLKILIEGNADYWVFPPFLSDRVDSSPIVVRFDHGDGRVLFTSAHNEGQNTSDLQNVLNYIVFEL